MSGLMIGNMQDVVLASGSNIILVPSTGTVYSASFPLKYAEYFGVYIIKKAGTGTISIKVQFQESYVVPDTEGASDSKWVIPEGMPDVFSNINDALARIKNISPVPMKLGRFVFTGLGSNPSDAALTVKLFTQQRV